jgi:hypothetical protein
MKTAAAKEKNMCLIAIVTVGCWSKPAIGCSYHLLKEVESC